MTTPDSEVTRKNCLEWMVLSGSPRTVLDMLVAFVDAIGGPFGTLIMTQKDWDKPALHKRSMELLANDVMPKLNRYFNQVQAAE